MNMKKLLNPLFTTLARAKIAQSYRQASRRQTRYDGDGLLTESVMRFPDSSDRYRYFHHTFHHSVPASLRAHRCYFKAERRGFGEDAFHAMWWQLWRQYRPKQCLEIGVYRGQIISLWSLIAHELQIRTTVSAISPFTKAGDSVSRYLDNLDYESDVRASFRYFHLPQPHLIKDFSTDPKALDFIRSRKWDLIYIDGSHDFADVLADYKNCKKQLTKDGILVFDDAGLNTEYRPLLFSFAGHPGPSRVVNEYVSQDMSQVVQVGHNRVFQNKVATHA